MGTDRACIYHEEGAGQGGQADINFPFFKEGTPMLETGTRPRPLFPPVGRPAGRRTSAAHRGSASWGVVWCGVGCIRAREFAYSTTPHYTAPL